MLDSAISGIHSALDRMSIASHNIANVNTAGYTRRSRGFEPIPGQDSADLSRDMLDQTVASYAVKANAIIIRTANEMQSTVLDIIA